MSARYHVGSTATCGECRERITLVNVPAAEGELWIHNTSRMPFCWRDPQHTETAWPESLLGDQPSSILGFLVQCHICPQRALVVAQPDGDWTCPRCAEVTGGFGDVDVAQAERPDQRQNRLIGNAIGIAADVEAGDHYPITKVRG